MVLFSWVKNMHLFHLEIYVFNAMLCNKFMYVILVRVLRIYMYWFWYILYIYNRLRSASGLKSTSSPQIHVHWCHYLRSRCNLRVFSNCHPFQIFRSMANLLVRVRVTLGHMSVTSLDVDLRKWEMAIDLRIGHQFENLKKDIDLRIGGRFENWMSIKDWALIRGWTFICVLPIHTRSHVNWNHNYSWNVFI